MLAQVSDVMKSGSHFAFTVESVPQEQQPEKGFRLLTNGRFGYVKSYIDHLINGQVDKSGAKSLNIIM
jgi:predicted TPR repeat methyltransferase